MTMLYPPSERGLGAIMEAWTAWCNIECLDIVAPLHIAVSLVFGGRLIVTHFSACQIGLSKQGVVEVDPFLSILSGTILSTRRSP